VEELRRYDTTLYEKPRWLVLNKLDMVPDPQAATERLCKLLDWQGPVFGISAMTGDGTQELIWALQDWLDADKQQEQIAQDKLEGIYVEDDPRFDPARSNTDSTGSVSEA